MDSSDTRTGPEWEIWRELERTARQRDRACRSLWVVFQAEMFAILMAAREALRVHHGSRANNRFCKKRFVRESSGVDWIFRGPLRSQRRPSGFMQKNDETSRDSMQASGGCGGIVRSSDPSKFVSLIGKSSDQLMEHLHVLTQEALDHADLSVLTGTIGAAAILKNCLWFYIQIINEIKNASLEPLQNGYKKYEEMCEALAERLLDLHCRLLSLYILQDADCLDWESEKPFFESERGSYIVQMWWLYMQGTREDLWNTVPPKMAQRVFAGMLNESLTILTVRYTQSSPSEARSHLLLVDVSNLLLCVAQLLPSICDTTEEFIGFSLNNRTNILRDIHTKCQDLFYCFLVRGASLDTLHKLVRNGIENIEICKTRSKGPMPWTIFALPGIFKNLKHRIETLDDLDDSTSISLELTVLLAQPQPNWALLLRVVCNKNFKVLQHLIQAFFDNLNTELPKANHKPTDCNGFLCPGDGSCKNVDSSSPILNDVHYYDLIRSLTDIILYIGSDAELNDILISTITKQRCWSKCLDRRQVWNQNRLPWFDALLDLVCPLVPLVRDSVVNALQTGATMYQAMSLILACLSQYWDVVNPCLPRIATLLQEVIPTETIPLANSVLMQILISALYTSLIDVVNEPRRVSFEDTASVSSANRNEAACSSSLAAVALAAAEALCSIDEDNKHTDQIDEFLDEVKSRKDFDIFIGEGHRRIDKNPQIGELLVSELLLTAEGKHSLKVVYHFIKNNSEWLFSKLGVAQARNVVKPNQVIAPPQLILHKMFLIGSSSFDQLLTGELKPNWQVLLQTPMGLSPERLWMQMSLRWEFRDANSGKLALHDVQIIDQITSILKQ
ncbi:uncharacterized protein LOC132700308 isoform X2 [Cylas formicarius]|uniref:uncharacterized protein LOC132700308 isoform X2 n=1 Tax=Cylas formicarius TaxID=197179 RepID=UPI002958C9B3|nr:uncharacterized protein LOC132700308 isoform X2 [Cylas formicarius]